MYDEDRVTDGVNHFAERTGRWMIDIALTRIGQREYYAPTADQFAINHKIRNRIDKSLEPSRSRSKSRGPPASSERRWTPVETRSTLDKLDTPLDDMITEENKEIDESMIPEDLR